MATFAFSRLSSGTVKVVADTNTYFFGGATKLDPNDTLERIIIFDSFGKKLDIDTSADTVTIEGVTATGTATEIAEDLATDIFFLASGATDSDLIREADYIVEKISTTYYARAAAGSGLSDYSGAAFATVFQNAINALTPAGAAGSGGGHIHILEGDYQMQAQVTITGWEGVSNN
jgi:hypothetical protein